MINESKVADVDLHIIEPDDLWDRYLDPRYRDDGPQFIRLSGQRNIVLGNHLTLKRFGTNSTGPRVIAFGRGRTSQSYQQQIEMGWSPEAQLLAMDREGIDMGFLYPTIVLSIADNVADDPVPGDMLTAINKAYNTWIGEFVATRPDRLIPIAWLLLHDPDAAVAECRRAASVLRCPGIAVRPEPTRGRTIDHPEHEPVWDELEHLNLALGVHCGTSNHPTLGANRFTHRWLSHTCGHPMEQWAALVGLIGNGILERHPKLRVAFLEAGAGWLPYCLWRLDEHYELLGAVESANLSMTPSEYFRRQCWVSVEADEPFVKHVAEAVGEDRMVISSDVPHWDHAPGVLRLFAERKDIKESLKNKVLWSNTMRLYNQTAAPAS